MSLKNKMLSLTSLGLRRIYEEADVELDDAFEAVEDQVMPGDLRNTLATRISLVLRQLMQRFLSVFRGN